MDWCYDQRGSGGWIVVVVRLVIGRVGGCAYDDDFIFIFLLGGRGMLTCETD
jgi:hypothetical protein